MAKSSKKAKIKDLPMGKKSSGDAAKKVRGGAKKKVAKKKVVRR
jgi:hypothetical protein